MAENEFLDLVGLLRANEVKFRLVPEQICGFSCGADLEWFVVRFTSSNANSVPDGRGVYAFVVDQTDIGLPPHGYVMYIGKAGDGRNTLRKRFKSYFQEKKRIKRPHIHLMLNQWEQVLSFYYAEINAPGIRLTDVEVALNDALLPPFSKNDFSASIRAAINAFES